MQRVRAIWQRQRGRRHVWKVDEVVGGSQRHIIRVLVRSLTRLSCEFHAGSREEIS